jgi:hypothetical protein
MCGEEQCISQPSITVINSLRDQQVKGGKICFGEVSWSLGSLVSESVVGRTRGGGRPQVGEQNYVCPLLGRRGRGRKRGGEAEKGGGSS